MTDQATQTFTFQAEIQQLLSILVHSLYTDQEIFLRELISNASDALNRVQFELLTHSDLQDADTELYIEIKADEEAQTLTISDTGIGMTRDDLINHLGVIARSGAKAFIEALKHSKDGSVAQNVIGQFGVGFYSVFMVADRVRVVSRSHLPGEAVYAWESTGGNEFTIEPAEREIRGTDIILHLKPEMSDFLKAWSLKQIIRKHSDYIAFPIYVSGEEEAVNKQTAIWRQQTSEITEDAYNDFYKMLTLDFNQPLKRIHFRADSPLQFYALLYVPSSREPNMFSPRKEPGLKLYARKVLIQEYSKDLLPEYLNFIQGVVDSEDLPLNVNRESVQANKIMVNLKKAITSKILNELKRMARNQKEEYLKIYAEFSRHLKQGVVISPEDREHLEQLLFYASTHHDQPDDLISLDDYLSRMAENQADIYYIIGDDFHSARRSPHLDAFRQRGIEVLYFTDPVDAAVIMGLTEYKGHAIRSVDESDIDLNNVGTAKSEDVPKLDPVAEADFVSLQTRFKTVLAERVKDVRESKTLVGSPARLVSDESGASRQMFRINRLMDRDYEFPVKTLELNPRHPLIHNLTQLLGGNAQNPVIDLVVEQVFETALLQDGIHPDPASMAGRLTALMQAATGTPVEQIDYKVEPKTQVIGLEDEG
ncbi:MAG: molecular chaperone HtpG [Anaerolineae bacterium]|nr:molecular chaperone HtpG [Anaerolineae bacterium]